jgi:hypothetical protein
MLRFPGNGMGLARGLVWLAVLSYAALLFVYCHARITILDEDQFLAAAQLMGSYLPYRDYIYFQTPFYPLFLAALKAIFGDVGFLFLARTASWALGMGILAMIYIIARGLTGSSRLAWLTALLGGLSPLLLFGMSSARNDVLPVFLGLAGLALVFPYLQAAPTPPKGARLNLRLFFSGLLLALAVATKLTAAFLPAVLLVAFTVKAKHGSLGERGGRALACFVAGGAAGSLPILIFAALAPEPFFLDILAFHRSAPFLWYQEIGEAWKLEWTWLAVVVGSTLVQDPSLLLALLFLYAVAIHAALRGGLRDLHLRLRGNGGYVILALLAFSFLLCAQPKPHLIHYFIPVAPFLLLSAAAIAPKPDDFWGARARALRRPLQALALLLLLLPLSSAQVRNLLFPPAESLAVENWAASKASAAAERIAGQLEPLKPLRPLASLNPLYLVEAGLPLMPEFASSIFFYRTADHEAPETVRKAKGLSPSLVSEVLDEARPSAVLIGAEFDFLAAPLLEWALSSGYRETASPGEGLRLFLAPAGD